MWFEGAWGMPRGVDMQQDHPETTQEGQPSGTNPVRARDRLAMQWVLVPLVIAGVFVVGFGLKILF